MNRRRFCAVAVALVVAWAGLPAAAEQAVAVKFDRATLEAKWRARIQSLLDRGMVPLIDLESTIRRDRSENDIAPALPVMDETGVALIAFDSAQAPRDGKRPGYRWGYFVHDLANAHPDRFILATNGGTNPNWSRQYADEQSFVAELEREMRRGDYAIFGEIEFRHYKSDQQCREGRDERDVDIPIDGPLGHRVFRLARQTGKALVIHYEFEDRVLPALERMLAAYSDVRVVIAHFGQIRHPEREKGFGPDLVRGLLQRFANLHFDISVGPPNRRYQCTGQYDTVIWQSNPIGGQSDVLKPEYRAIYEQWSDRFVIGLDYDGSKPPLAEWLPRRSAVLRLILRDLPPEVQHAIGWRNAWRLLTGRDWR